LGFDNYFVVNCKGRSGGLILLWKNNIQVSIQNYSCRHVNAEVCFSNNGPCWKFTGFYGHLEAIKRPKAWSLLRHLARLAPWPWLVVGDFNEITGPGEKTSCSVHPSRHMNDFRITLSDCQLGDLGFSGQKFTWNNGRSGAGNTLEQLDMAVANPGWCNLFDVVEVQVLPCCSLDHNPLFVSFSNSAEVQWTKQRQFLIEAACVKN
jgi:hypothetical protein